MARPWAAGGDVALAAAWSAGTAPKLIGEALGRSAGAVRLRAKHLELPPRSGVGIAGQAGWTPVKVNLPAELLPPIRQRGVVIRDALALRQRMAPHEGPPPRTRIVLVRRSDAKGDVALCRYVFGETGEYRMQGTWGLVWITAADWPKGYRWLELPGEVAEAG